jgi:hypothetical protein
MQTAMEKYATRNNTLAMNGTLAMSRTLRAPRHLILTGDNYRARRARRQQAQPPAGVYFSHVA